MDRNLSFFLVVTSIMLAIDIYVWQGVKFLSQNWSDRARNIVKIAYWGYTAINFLFFLSWRMGWLTFSPQILRLILTIAFVLVMAKILWIAFLLVDDVIRVVRWIGSKFIGTDVASDITAKDTENTGISRLKFLNYLGFGIGATFMASAVYGISAGAHKYQIKRRKLAIKGLPKAFEGLRIVQISDIHSGSFWNHSAVKKGVDMLNAEKADMVFFTGDLVNDVHTEMDTWKSLFSTIKAPMGVYSILGNHDYGDYVQWHDKEAKHNIPPHPDKSHMSPMQMANLQKLIHTHKELGWDLLLDENRIIEKDGEKIAVVGVENWSSKLRFPKYGNLSQAYKGLENMPVTLLLSHDPSHWKAEVLPQYPNIQATFSGHTHGMQFGIDSSHYRWSPVKYMYQEWMDLYSENGRHLYVNRGFGYLGFPGRIGIFPEITVFTLSGV